jgi:hypothetical protein
MRHHDRTWKDQPRRLYGPGVLILAIIWTAFWSVVMSGCLESTAGPPEPEFGGDSHRIFAEDGRPLVPVTCVFFSQADGTYQYPRGEGRVYIVAEDWQ